VIALLVIAPSKTDRERVIPMGAELFHVIASIIRRHTQAGRSIPLLSRFDPHDKVWSPQLPFLFQRRDRFHSQRHRGRRRPEHDQTALRRAGRAAPRLPHHPRFTPHDFRRIFATELVNSGLPIHIGAALLGHLNNRNHPRLRCGFRCGHRPPRRRLPRPTPPAPPAEEYRDTKGEEWVEFEEHFDKRKVELGSCGRPYGTGAASTNTPASAARCCTSPKMLAWLDGLETDLVDRCARAEAEAGASMARLAASGSPISGTALPSSTASASASACAAACGGGCWPADASAAEASAASGPG
jgi:Phage integrase family